MSEVDLHAPFDGYHGAIGKIVYRNYKGRTIASLKPKANRTLKPAEIAHRQRFTEGAGYAKTAMADPDKRAIYEAASLQKDKPAFALAVADFLKEPTIESLDLSQYAGKLGDSMLIATKDDIGVVDVTVRISTTTGTTIETGKAVEVGDPRSGNWIYTATKPVAAGTDLFVQVTAVDLPGNSAEYSANPTVGE